MARSESRQGVGSVKLGTWVWYYRDPPSKEILHGIQGKYLFFSEDRGKLEKIAKDEITTNGFGYAKVPAKGENIGVDYVLCLYYKDDSRRFELAEKYRDDKDVRYRYWKSDQDTLDGKYSAEFVKDLGARGETLDVFQRREGDKK